MDDGVIRRAEYDEKILTSDVPRAGLYCTSDWYSCGLPQILAF
jgi:hypothetical protein